MPLTSLHHKECPNCTAKMERSSVPGVWVCPYCGDEFVENIPQAEQQPQQQKPAQKEQPQQQQPSEKEQPRKEEAPEQKPKKANPPKVKSDKGNALEDRSALIRDVINLKVPENASIYIIKGINAVRQSARYPHAVAAFHIPQKEVCYLLFDATLFGSCNRGFALCTKGIYHCPSFGPRKGMHGFIPYKDLATMTVHVDNSGNLCLGNAEFNTGSDRDLLLSLLKEIQSRLRDSASHKQQTVKTDAPRQQPKPQTPKTDPPKADPPKQQQPKVDPPKHTTQNPLTIEIVQKIINQHRQALYPFKYVVLDDANIRCDTRYQKARNNFGIPAEETLYLLHDCTVFGSCSSGFALGSKGIYYKANTTPSIPFTERDLPRFLSWEDFRSVKLSKLTDSVYLGDWGFDSGPDATNLYNLLCDVQSALNQ